MTTQRSTLASPATFTQRCLDAVSDVGTDDGRDAFHPVTYNCEYQPTRIHFCYIFIYTTASHEILMQFAVIDHFPTLVTLPTCIPNTSRLMTLMGSSHPPPSSPHFSRRDSRSDRSSGPWLVQPVQDIRRTFHEDSDVLHRRPMLLPFRLGAFRHNVAHQIAITRLAAPNRPVVLEGCPSSSCSLCSTLLS